LSAKIDTFALAILLEQLGRQTLAPQALAGLKPAQWQLLRYLLNANDSARTILGFIRHTGCDRGVGIRAETALLTNSLIVKAEDGRLDLLPAGHDRLEADPLREVAQLLDEVDAVTLNTFAEVLMTLVSRPGAASASNGDFPRPRSPRVVRLAGTAYKETRRRQRPPSS
jgi:hypothetical protein